MPAPNGSTRESAAPIPRQVEVSRLLLDAANPRLAAGRDVGDAPSQKELATILWQEETVEEIAYSIAENGYYPQEPLIVVPMRDGTDNLVVVEGNRRLAAVKLLLDDSLRKDAKAKELPRLSVQARLALEVLPVLEYADRRDVWAYLGFRHINGTKPWDAYSKAKYIATVRDEYDVDLAEIARRIGDRNATVVRLYNGLKVLEQAERDIGFDRDDRFKRRFSFSHLYTALDQPEFRKFLGVTDGSFAKPNPVPVSKAEELRLLMLWLYGSGSRNIPPLVQTQNPDLNRLREAIGSSQGLSLLRSGRPLAVAHEASRGYPRRFRDAMAQAQEELVTAKGTVTEGYSGESDLLQTAESIRRLVDSLIAEMMAVRTKTDEGRSVSGDH